MLSRKLSKSLRSYMRYVTSSEDEPLVWYTMRTSCFVGAVVDTVSVYPNEEIASLRKNFSPWRVFSLANLLFMTQI